MGRRSDNPMSILVMGITMIGGFGISLVLLTNKTPVLKLKPQIETEFKLSLRTRFRIETGSRPAALELILAKGEDWPITRDEELAAWSLRRYISLARETDVGKTSVNQVEILTEEDPSPRYVLRRRLVESRDEAERQRDLLKATVESCGYRDVQVEIAYGKSGARLNLQVTPREQLSPKLARVQAFKAIHKLSQLGFVGGVEIRSSDGFYLLGGRDHPSPSPQAPKRRRVPPKRPGSNASPAPVTSKDGQ